LQPTKFGLGELENIELYIHKNKNGVSKKNKRKRYRMKKGDKNIEYPSTVKHESPNG